MKKIILGVVCALVFSGCTSIVYEVGKVGVQTGKGIGDALGIEYSDSVKNVYGVAVVIDEGRTAVKKSIAEEKSSVDSNGTIEPATSATAAGGDHLNQ